MGKKATDENSAPEPIVVLVTCGSEDEASTIAHSLVEDRLAACVNIVPPVRSIYRWEEKIWDEREWLLLVKTEKDRFGALQRRITSLHSYSVPEIIALPVVLGSSPYFEWLLGMTRP